MTYNSIEMKLCTDGVMWLDFAPINYSSQFKKAVKSFFL